jgi:ABC-type cobalamin/Fe3+-siderophores transport system ATPase subunit
VTSFYDLVFGDYYSVAPTVKYKGTQLQKLSLGQKATVLMKIYLAQGDKPIIIDSHDDHLDNEFIMDELVKAIRQAKQYRQVILASNNGNVVINSDSEQIIIATRKDGEISYNAGSIENPEIYTHAIKVLEGGSEAFRQRQLKYRISE